MIRSRGRGDGHGQGKLRGPDLIIGGAIRCSLTKLADTVVSLCNACQVEVVTVGAGNRESLREGEGTQFLLHPSEQEVCSLL